jgi:hypothetical protein
MMGYFDTQHFMLLAEAVINYLEAATKEIEVRTALMGIEYQESVAKQEQERETREKQEQGQGMMRAPYGYCPECGAIGVYRHRLTNRDKCANDHIYPSNTAVLRPDKKNTEENHVNGNDNQSQRDP